MEEAESAGLARTLFHRTVGWNIVGYAAGLVSSLATARMLLPEFRGLFGVTMTGCSVIILVVAMGTNVSVRVYLPRKLVSARTYVRLSGKLLPLSAVAAVSFCVVYGVLFLRGLLDVKFLIAVAWWAVAAYGCGQLADLYNALGRTNDSARAIFAASCITAVLLCIAWVAGGGLTEAMVCYAIGSTTRLIWSALDLRPAVAADRVEVSGAQRTLIVQGLKLLPLNVGQTLAFRLDQLVIGALMTSTDVGIYAVATTPIAVPEVISSSIAQVVFFGRASGKMSKKSALRWAGLAAFQTAIVGALVTMFGPWAISLVFGAEFDVSHSLLAVMALSEVVLAPYIVLSRAVAGDAKVGLAGFGGILGIAVTLAAVVLLVPRFGLPGAALGDAIGYCVMSGCSVVFLLRKPALPVEV